MNRRLERDVKSGIYAVKLATGWYELFVHDRIVMDPDPKHGTMKFRTKTQAIRYGRWKTEQQEKEVL